MEQTCDILVLPPEERQPVSQVVLTQVLYGNGAQ